MFGSEMDGYALSNRKTFKYVKIEDEDMVMRINFRGYFESRESADYVMRSGRKYDVVIIKGTSYVHDGCHWLPLPEDLTPQIEDLELLDVSGEELENVLNFKPN